MRIRTRALGVLLALASLTACSDGGSWTGTVTDSAGVTIVVNTDRGMWGEGEGWTLEEELRIGTIEGDLEYQFGQIGLIAVDSRDRIFVLDMQARDVRVFSSDGTYEQTIAQPGSGPGELGAQIGALFMGPGDTLLIPDLANQRVNRYAPDGTSLGSFPLRLENGLPMSIVATRTGVVAEQVRPISLPDMPARDSMDFIVTLATDGSVLDTLMRFPPGAALVVDSRGAQRTIFAAEPVWTLSDELELFFGITSEYRISVFDPEGNLRRIVTKPVEPTPVTERDKEMMWEVIEQQIRDAVPPDNFVEFMQQARQTITFAEFFPAFVSMSIGPNGSIWVQHLRPPAEVTEEELETYDMQQDIGSRDWDVFDPDGRYLGVVTMPPRFTPRIILGGKIYGVWRDDLDVQYAVRLRIVEG
ncbi:MAG: 6-bladed beta-propeller [Gemmatimonadota bacterium]|nr:MAG: 6-bladed beta-propeller [Gemmatimonadota bacterium]